MVFHPPLSWIASTSVRGGSHSTRPCPVFWKRTADPTAETLRSPRPMSNTSIVTKLLTLVKGAFGRKETASGAVQEPRAEGEGRTAENGGGEQKISTATTERTEQAAPAERAAPSVVVDEDTAAAETPEEEPAPSPEAEKPEPAETPAPATDDVPEKDAAIAKELDTNENHTEVASDEVLERVRKGAAPSAEELAVPTYDELT